MMALAWLLGAMVAGPIGYVAGRCVGHHRALRLLCDVNNAVQVLDATEGFDGARRRVVAVRAFRMLRGVS